MSKTSQDFRKVSQDRGTSPKLSGSEFGSFDSSQRKLSTGATGKCVCEGYLKQKEKGLFGMDAWNKFFYCVISQGLFKLPSPTNNNVKESWPLKECKVLDFDQVSGKSHSFCVFIKDGTKVVLQAENPFDKQRWMASISAAAQKERVPHALVLDSLNDAGVGADEQCVIRAVNDKAVKIFGYSKKEELVGQNVTILMTPTMAKLHDGFLQKYLQTGQKSLIGNIRRLVGRHKNGTLFPVEVSLGETDQEDCRFLAIFRPVAEEKKEVEFKSELEIKSATEVDVLKAKLEDGLDEQMDKIRANLSAGFDELKQKLEDMIEEDNKKKLQLNQLYETLKKVKAETKLLKEELALYRKEGTVSIHQLLRSSDGRQAFLEFCGELKCEEMLLFWIEAENLKKLSNSDWKPKVTEIFHKFLAKDAPKPLNTNTETLKSIESKLNNPPQNIYLDLQKEMLFLLADNAFKKFCVSGIGKAIIGNLDEFSHS